MLHAKLRNYYTFWNYESKARLNIRFQQNIVFLNLF